MRKHKKIWLVVLAGIILEIPGCISEEKRINNKKEKLRQEIRDNKDTLYSLNPKMAKQEQDSIASFDQHSPNSLLLQQKEKEKLALQINLTKITEKYWQEYWGATFPKYKQYIKSQFSEQEIKDLSHYVGNTHFTLSCDLDTNYYETIDDILYGPYWREFADAAEDIPLHLIKKYRYVRANAENLYPYIFVKNVFYDGGKITQYYKNKTDEENVEFTNAIKLGVGALKQSGRDVKPEIAMYDFNRLRNKSKMFTVDLHMFLESVYVSSSECIDLKSPLFASHYTELSDVVHQIILLTHQINKLNAQRNAEIQKIQKYFKKEQAQQELETLERVKELQDSLDYYESMLSR